MVPGAISFDITVPLTRFRQVKFNIWGFKLSTRSKYKCNACGYTAQVWDAPDPAPIATVDTRHCLGCKSLVEVPIEFHGGGLLNDQKSTPGFLNRCPNCDSPNVKHWDTKHSCPKCSEHMTQEVAKA